MTRLRVLAASIRPLSDVLIDSLRRRAKPHLHGDRNEPDDGDGARQLDLRLDDNAADDSKSDPPSVLRPGEVAAAVLVGRALDPRRDLLAKLRDRDSIAVIEVPAPELTDSIKLVLKTLVLGTEAPVLDDSELGLHDASIAALGTVALFVGKDDGKAKKPAPGNARFAAAVQQRCAIIGIATDPDRLLPPDLVRLADHRVVVPPLDDATIAAVIEAVTGRHPGHVDDALARRVTLEALTIAVRADFGAERSLARLRHLVGKDSAPAEPSPTLSELHGLGAARDWGLSLIEDLKNFCAGRLPWAAVDRGCLLTGVPGTGKTTFARALAKEAGVHFVATSYSQWQAYKEGHLGHVTQAIRNAFAEARQHAPAILFIDEIDTLPPRGSGKGNDDWWTSITNTLLEMLDGFERREGVVVIAACNDARRLDPALKRAGRLDRHIAIPLPDVPALIGIFRTHLGADLAGADLRGAALAARGFTGADVERFVREARRRARAEAKLLALPHLIDAVRGGEPEWPDDVRWRLAYHEAGHAVIVQALGLAEPKSLSIGGAGGAAESDTIDKRPLTRAYLENYLVVLLAGRASEELVFGEATAGAGGSAEGSDLAHATDLAMRIEVNSGLGAFGLVCIAGEPNKRDLLLADDLRTTVGRTLARAHAVALDLLTKNRLALDALAQALFAAGYLDRAEIAAVFGKVPLDAHGVPSPAPAASPQMAPSARGKAHAQGLADEAGAPAPAGEPGCQAQADDDAPPLAHKRMGQASTP
jgi:cell division protease FtsH